MTGEEARVAFLEWLGRERRAAALTVEAYGADIAGFLGFLTQHLGGEPGVNILLAGGTFKFPTLSTSGDKAASFFDNILAEKLFLATACISPRVGLSYPSETDIKVKTAMINSADIVFVVADSTKIDKISMFALPCDWHKLHYLITDSGITPGAKAAFEALGVTVLVAETPSMG